MRRRGSARQTPSRLDRALEVAPQMVNHDNARTTGLCDRRDDQLSLDEVERILI
jgi:hypothetical protein